MNNLTGKWIGQYIQEAGQVEKSEKYINSFELKLIDINGEICGNSIDLDLNNETGVISGFYEDGVLSFIKKYHRFIYQDDTGNVFADDIAKPQEIHYTATYNESDRAFGRFIWVVKRSDFKKNIWMNLIAVNFSCVKYIEKVFIPNSLSL